MIPVTDLILLGLALAVVATGIVLVAYFALRLKGLPELEARWAAYARSRGYAYRPATRGWQSSRGPGSPPAMVGSIDGIPFEVEAYRYGSSYRTFFKTAPRPLPEATYIAISRRIEGSGEAQRHGLYWMVSPNIQFLATDARFDHALALFSSVPSFERCSVQLGLRAGQSPECCATTQSWCCEDAMLDAMIRGTTRVARLW